MTEPRKWTSVIWPERLALYPGAVQRNGLRAQRQRHRIAGVRAVEPALDGATPQYDPHSACASIADGAFQHVERADEIGDELGRGRL